MSMRKSAKELLSMYDYRVGEERELQDELRDALMMFENFDVEEEEDIMLHIKEVERLAGYYGCQEGIVNDVIGHIEHRVLELKEGCDIKDFLSSYNYEVDEERELQDKLRDVLAVLVSLKDEEERESCIDKVMDLVDECRCKEFEVSEIIHQGLVGLLVSQKK